MKNCFLVVTLFTLLASCGSDKFKPADDSKLIIDKSTGDYNVTVYAKASRRAENSLSWRITNRELIAYDLPFMDVARNAAATPSKYFTSNVSDSLKNSFFDIQVKRPLSKFFSDSSMWKIVLYELSEYYEVKKSERFKTVESNVIFVKEPELIATFDQGILTETQVDSDSLKFESVSVAELASFLNHACELHIFSDVVSKKAYKIHIKRSCDRLELQRELERFGLGIKTEMRPQVFYTFSQ